MNASSPTASTAKTTYNCWSEAEVQSLVNLVRRNVQYAEIAEALDRSVRDITVKVSKLRAQGYHLPYRCSHRRWSAAEKTLVLEMAEKKCSYQQMAEATGFSTQQITNQLHYLRSAAAQ